MELLPERISCWEICKVFTVSKSGFYLWRNYVPPERESENQMLLFEIRRIHQQSKASCRSPRIIQELRSRGFDISKPRARRLMKQNGIRAIHARKFVVITTDSKHEYPVVETNSTETSLPKKCLGLGV